ncbi:MAG: citrate/2-methylcitrate synthase, partial [Candidatus Micrarchaeaceae archaeon]
MADNTTPTIIKGLEGVYFTETKICKVDGANGRLWYRGYSIENLAKNSSFEEVSYLILYGNLPTKDELGTFKKKLVSGMDLPKQVADMIAFLNGKMPPIDVLRTVVSCLPAFTEKKVYQSDSEEYINESVEIIGRICGIVATMGALLEGKKYTQPDSSLGIAQNMLYMMKGGKVDDKAAKMLDIMMLLHAEHSSNASTFCTIVAGSTLADIYSAVTAGICALKGSLHGGADEKAL